MQSSVKQQPSTRAVTPTTTVTPTTNTPTANMPTVTPVQAGPRQPTAMKPGGLIDATRLMIDLYHKTKRQAFLAMDKARAASSIFVEHTRGLACSALAQISQLSPNNQPACLYGADPPKPKPAAPY